MRAQVSFTLNGKALGVAFEEIRVFEPQLAYFPAVSLSEGEAAYVNLGNIPLRFPVEGFRPMQAPPPVHRAMQCTWLLEKLASMCTVWPSHMHKLSVS
jgi:Kip1 ubiquitination-promoting complex protein 1